MRKKRRMMTLFLALLAVCGGWSAEQQSLLMVQAADGTEQTDAAEGQNVQVLSENRIPETLEPIPEGYDTPAEQQGTIEKLTYTTYESMSYEEKSEELTKTAYVYLPYGYSEEEQYNVFYLMHGGWSNETTMLGTDQAPNTLKNVIDHAIQAGEMQPMIIVCPTYNNTSPEDSASYSLALQLTDNYHNELVNDLIPAVESRYSTFAEDTTPEGISVSRDHRGFGGFSMGSVATWHTFQYCLDDFRYFMPMSGSLTTDGSFLDQIVKNSGYGSEDFFIYAMSGTDDFAYSSFTRQIEAMLEVPDGSFRQADNEQEGNVAFRVQEGGTHSGEFADQYIYNGLCWFWSAYASETEAETESSDSNILVAYFSMPEDIDTEGIDADAGASIVVKDDQVMGNLEYMAGIIGDVTGGDLFRIETVEEYPLDHEPLVDQAAEEQDEEARPELATQIEHLDQYDTILLGYPNWWGDLPMPLYTFLETYDFSGKTIIPFTAHGGSGFSDTVDTIAELQPEATVSEEGFSISRNEVADAEEEIRSWAEGLNLQ